MKGNMSLFKIKAQVLLLVLCCFSGLAHAQLLDSLSLDTTTAFTSLEEALKQPENVIKLSLRRKKLKVFPPEIFKFPNLQYLDLSKNDIEELPSEIGNLKNLQTLIMSKNELTTVPAEI